ncbi:MAG: UDP-glucose dehydrogenase family protein [Candidatus Hodarchaeales archaeon]|jgi:UDPglucose 6-dehydrogenase
MSKQRIAIHGTGFIGLVSAACFATRDFPTICSTFDENFYEDGLDILLKQAINSGNLKCVIGREKAILNSDISMITVGTPMMSDGSINLKFMRETAEYIGKSQQNITSYHTVVVRSTVVPGTTRNLLGKIIEKNSGMKMGKDFGLCMQPEFLAEGRSIQDTLKPDRVVIGEYNIQSGDILESFYRDFYGDHLENCPILRMNLESAELVKYGNNSFLATKISFANEMARIAELVPGVDIEEVMKAVGLDYRVNHRFFGSGVGFGGACFPKDLNAIISFSKKKSYTPQILNAVLEVNKNQTKHIVKILKDECGDLSNKRITVLGLSFKPGTDDMRHAPSIKVINELKLEGAEIIAHDPFAEESAKKILKDSVVYADTIEEALTQADGAILVTEWEDYQRITPKMLKNLMKTPIVVDGRHLFDYDEFTNEIRFRTIGRK